jgi:hypothetical protein
MSTSATLQELARQVRRDTLQMLGAAHPSWLTFAPPGTSNHMLWHAGHALWLQDVLCIELLTGKREQSSDWDQTFGMNCRPVQQTTAWPSREKLTELLQAQLQRILELLAGATDEQLKKTADARRGPATVADRIIHGLHDEAKHSGEMYLLFKWCRNQCERP